MGPGSVCPQRPLKNLRHEPPAHGQSLLAARSPLLDGLQLFAPPEAMQSTDWLYYLRIRAGPWLS